MFNIGPQELLLILLVALVIVGPKRLPELSRTIGRGLREFRKAQEEVTKTIRLGLDETEPTSTPADRAPASRAAPEPGAAAAPATAPEPAPAPEPDEAADIARTLGRGLAEIRRARQEIQRSFRVDLSDRPARPARRSTTVSAPGSPQSPTPPPARSEDPTSSAAQTDGPPPAQEGPSQPGPPAEAAPESPAEPGADR